VAEDDESVRNLTRKMLEAQGYTVLTATSGTDALLRAQRHAGPIHLLVTDVVMPGLGGRDLAQRLGLERPHMKVLYLSGYTDETVARYGMLEPGIAFLQKPFNAERLARKVRQVLEGGPEG